MRKLILGMLLVFGTSAVYPQQQGNQNQNQNQNQKAPEIDLTNVVPAVALLGGTALIIRARRKK